MSNTEHETEPHIHPGQTPVVRVLLYCFKPPMPRTAASPPPRQAETTLFDMSIRLVAGIQEPRTTSSGAASLRHCASSATRRPHLGIGPSSHPLLREPGELHASLLVPFSTSFVCHGTSEVYLRHWLTLPKLDLRQWVLRISVYTHIRRWYLKSKIEIIGTSSSWEFSDSALSGMRLCNVSNALTWRGEIPDDHT